jgi:sarcosine oxidase, subunit delta
MQIFPCPWCGARPDAEFRYAGDAGKPRPPREASDAEWARYLYLRGNTRGAARELWVHAGGCGRWLVLNRDTVTHVVGSAEPMSP